LTEKVGAAYEKRGPKRAGAIISTVEKALHDMPAGMRVKINGAEFEKVEDPKHPEPFKDVNGKGYWEYHTIMDMVNPSRSGAAPEFYFHKK
jgi:hypothetical protein